jgi:hypothetical protein
MLLGGRGCAPCRVGDDAERRFFFWFWSESMDEPETIHRVVASRGLCPAHTRHLIESAKARGLTRLYAYVMRSALQDPSLPRATCLACERIHEAAAHAAMAIYSALGDREVFDAFGAHGGFCVPHFLRAAHDAPRDILEPLTEVVRFRLSEGRTAPPDLDFLIGRDADAPRRRAYRAHLDEDASNERLPVIETLRADACVDTCPVCREQADRERRFLSWLGARCPSAAGSVEELSGICFAHGHDVVMAVAAANDVVARAIEARWLAAIETFRERSGAPASAESATAPLRLLGEGALRAWWRDPRAEASSEARTRLLAPLRCPGCRERATAEQRRIRLLAAALADRRFLDVFERSHGLCLRHAETFTHDGIGARVWDRWRTGASLVLWELDEAARKTAWTARYEPPGDESSAWLRAMALLDGRVFLGSPPRRLFQTDERGHVVAGPGISITP